MRTPAFSQDLLKRRSAKSNGSLSFTFTDGILKIVQVVGFWAQYYTAPLFEPNNYKEAILNINWQTRIRGTNEGFRARKFMR